MLDNYKKSKEYFNKLNFDKSHFVNSNDICTPMECVEEMVDKIPKEVWKRKNLTILDPCAGNGNFHRYVYEKLIETRSKDVILKDVLFFNEINEKRIENVKNVFGKNINLSKIDFFKFTEKDKYDIVIANPPYAKFMKDGKRTAKNNNVSRDFILKGLSITKNDGYLVFIAPDNWMSLADRNKVVKNLSEYQFVWLNIHGAKKWFNGVGSSFTWFILKKIENKNDFFVENFYKIKSLDKVALPCGSSFIPLHYSKKVKSIFDKTIFRNDLEKFNIMTTSDLHKYTKKDFISSEKNDIFKHKLIHTPSQIVWSSRPHKFQNGWKVFVSLTDKYKTFIDNCGMTQSIAFILCDSKEQAKNYAKKLSHPLYLFLNNLCRYGNFNNIRVLQKFPISNEIDIYKYFKISSDEIKFIEKFLR